MSFIKVYYPMLYCPTPQNYPGYAFVFGFYEMVKEEGCELYDVFHRFFSLSFQDGRFGGKYIHGAVSRAISENFTWDLKAGYSDYPRATTGFWFQNLGSDYYSVETQNL